MQLLKHFKELSIYPKNAKELKGLILQLAVQGKLTQAFRERHPELISGSHSAKALLASIKEEKEQLIKDKKIKKEKPLPAITADEIPYDLPEGWGYDYIRNISSVVTCGVASTPTYTETGRMFLSAKNVKPFKFKPENHKFVSEEAYQKIIKNSKPEKGDVLLTRVGAGIGEACVIDQDIEFAFYVSLTLIKPMKGWICNKKLDFKLSRNYIFRFLILLWG